MANLLIASSNATFRRRLAQRLRRKPHIKRIHEATDRAGIERALATFTPRVLLLGFPMKGVDRLESVQRIRALSPTARIILLVESPDDSEALRAFIYGASGYCARKTDPKMLLKAIERVQRGDIWVPRKIILKLIQELTARESAHEGKADKQLRPLTRREREIVNLITTGARNKEIASRLSITERTVKAYLTSIFRKVGVSDRLRLAIYALKVELPGSSPSLRD